MKKKIYIIEYLGDGPLGDKYYDVFGPKNKWIGQYPSFQDAQNASFSCARNKNYSLDEVSVILK